MTKTDDIRNPTLLDDQALNMNCAAIAAAIVTPAAQKRGLPAPRHLANQKVAP